MLYQPRAEKTTMIQPLTVEDFTGDPAVKKTRFSLIIVLLIEIVVTVLTLIISFLLLVSAISHNSVRYESAKAILININITLLFIFFIPGIIMLIYFIAYIIAVVKYRRILILIFAWITVILIFIDSYLKISEIIRHSSATTKIVHNYVAFYSIGLAMRVVLSMWTIMFSFKLGKLIKEQRHQIV